MTATPLRNRDAAILAMSKIRSTVIESFHCNKILGFQEVSQVRDKHNPCKATLPTTMVVSGGGCPTRKRSWTPKHNLLSLQTRLLKTNIECLSSKDTTESPKQQKASFNTMSNCYITPHELSSLTGALEVHEQQVSKYRQTLDGTDFIDWHNALEMQGQRAIIVGVIYQD